MSFVEGSDAAVRRIAKHFGLDLPVIETAEGRVEALIVELRARARFDGATKPECKPGDVVQHKAGPHMVVVARDDRGAPGNTLVKCEWWTGTEFDAGWFSSLALQEPESDDVF